MTPLDPYKTFRFRLSWDARVVAGISEVSGMDAGPPFNRGPAIVSLRRGISQDAAFAAWVTSPGNTRRDCYLAIFDENGQKVTGYTILRCLPTKFINAGTSGLDELIIETLELQNEGVVADEVKIG